METSETMRLALVDLADRKDDEPAIGWHAIAVLDVLGFDEDDVFSQAARDKLKGRPCEAVRAFTRDALASKPEGRQHLLTQFAKTHGVVDG